MSTVRGEVTFPEITPYDVNALQDISLAEYASRVLDHMWEVEQRAIERAIG
jgi:hypothetical protein